MAPYQGELLHLQQERATIIQRLSGIRDRAMGGTVTWRGNACELRTLFYMLVEDDERRICQLQASFDALGWRQAPVHRILARGCVTRGQLRSALLAFPDARLDEVPALGEWTVREVLGHCLNVEQRYTHQTLYAVDRLDQQPQPPVQAPNDGMPPRVPTEPPAGTLDALLAQLDAIRAGLITAAQGLDERELAAPTLWNAWDIDVAFRLHRFASHEREHIIQISKTLRWLGHAQSEAQQILARAGEVRGELEGLLVGLPDDMRTLEAGPEATSIDAILRTALDQERALAFDIGQLAAGVE